MGFEDIFVGAISNGVNSSTLVAINAVLAMAFLSLGGLLMASIASNPPMVPHVVVLIFLELGLWVAINWFIHNIGLVDPADQHKELFGADGSASGEASGSQEESKGSPSGEGEKKEEAADAEGSKKDK
eukprot:gene20987-27844_t